LGKFRKSARFKTCKTDLKIKLETQKRKQRKRKRIETEKIEDWLTWPQPTAPAH
jgi:hypothetical protein